MKKNKKPYYNLISLREKNNYKQKDIADYLFISTRAYNHYENGDRNIPIETWKKLAKFYDTSIEYLCETSEEYDSKDTDEEKS